jgi:hypothetical protein
MKKTLIIVITTFFGLKLFSQDKLYKPDGTVIEVKIIEVSSSEIKYKRYNNQEGPTFIIPKKELLMLVYSNGETEVIKKQVESEILKLREKQIEFKKKGFLSVIESNFCYGVGTYGEYELGNNNVRVNPNYSFGFKIINGYQFNKNLSLGLGIGIESVRLISDQSVYLNLLPLTVDLKTAFLKSRVSPVFNNSFGYMFGLDNVRAGLYLNSSIGCRIYLNNKTALLLNIGYKIQQQECYRDDYNNLNPLYKNSISYLNPKSVSYFDSRKMLVFFHYLTFSTGFSF